MKPMLDPKRDLKGATPETLARALFRRVTPLRRPGPTGEAVVGYEVPVQQIPSDKPHDRAPHLRKRS